MNIDTFSDLILGVSEKDFFSYYWETKPLFLERHISNFYNSLFDEQDFFERLWAAMLPWGKVQLANHNTKPGHVDYSTLEPNSVTLAQAYEQGDTIVVNDLQNFLPELSGLTRIVARKLGFLSNINLYLTKGSQQGLSPHFDDQDVFILQISGKKRWSLFGAVSDLPLDQNLRLEPLVDYGEPESRHVLSAGDMLYLPRGVGHCAYSIGDEHSLHLTLSVTVIRWANLLSTLLQYVSESSSAFRKSLPVGLLAENGVSYNTQPQVKGLLHQAIDRLDVALLEESLDQLKLNLVENLKPDVGQRIAGKKYCSDVSSMVCKPKDTLLFSKVVNQELHVFFPGGSFVGAKELSPIVEYINKHDEFAVEQLPIEESNDKKIDIINELIKQGLLRLQEDLCSVP